MEKDPSKEELCSKIKEIYQKTCIEKKEPVQSSYFSPVNLEVHKVSLDLQNYSCINTINSFMKHCRKN